MCRETGATVSSNGATHQYVRGRYPPAVEPRVFICPLDNYRAVDLNACVKAPALQICEYRCLTHMQLCLDITARAIRSSHSTQLSADSPSHMPEGIDSFLSPKYQYTVVDVHSNEPAEPCLNQSRQQVCFIGVR